MDFLMIFHGGFFGPAPMRAIKVTLWSMALEGHKVQWPGSRFLETANHPSVVTLDTFVFYEKFPNEF